MRDERHPLDPISLVFGIMFVVFGLLGVTSLLTDVNVQALRWAVPAALVLAGLGILLAAVASPDRDRTAAVARDEPVADRALDEREPASADERDDHTARPTD